MIIFPRLSAIAILIACTTFTGAAFADIRVALVIGNGAYENAPRLSNPANDAADVAVALKRSGFETILLTDLNKSGMDDAAIRFARAARNADIAMLYYTGHALQFAGINYLAPVDAKLTDEADLKRMVRVDDIVADLQQAKNLRILVLDSCRDNPLADQLKRSIGATRALSLRRGLAKLDSPEGMIVAYATQAGRTAEDGKGRNSPYTASFLKHIETQEEIGTIFRRVSAEVYDTTHHTQLPELSLSLIGEFYLRGRAESAVEPNNSPNPDDGVRADYEAAQRVDTVAGWEAFLARHPVGYFAALAKESRAKAAALRIAAVPKEGDAQQKMSTTKPASLNPTQNFVLIDTTKGRIVIKLRPDIAPHHAERIRQLARDGYYNNVPWHRVMDGFMAQTGDGQNFNGTGGSKYPNLQAEFSSVPFKRGVVGMARRGDSFDTANSHLESAFRRAACHFRSIPASNKPPSLWLDARAVG